MFAATIRGRPMSDGSAGIITRRGDSLEASNTGRQACACRVEPRRAARPLHPAAPLRGQRQGGRRARAPRRADARAGGACGAPCAASRWRSTFRSRPISASRSGWSRPTASTPGAVSVVLEHRDSGLSLPLYRAADGTDIVAEWQSWARVLGVPLLVAEADGRLREPFDHWARLRIAAHAAAAAAHSPLRERRPTLRCGARPGRAVGNAHRASRRARDHRAELNLISASRCIPSPSP